MSCWIDASQSTGWKRLLFCCGVFVSCTLPCGCASQLNHQAQQSDGLLDFVARMARTPRENDVSIERYSGRDVEIVSASAVVERGSTTYVSGVLKRGFESTSDDDGHIDVKVIGPDHQLVTDASVNYSPRPIPITYHSVVGRAYFGVRLPFALKPKSTIQIIFRQDGRVVGKHLGL